MYDGPCPACKHEDLDEVILFEGRAAVVIANDLIIFVPPCIYYAECVGDEEGLHTVLSQSWV